MINCFHNSWSNFQDWTEELLAPNVDGSPNRWTYYVKDCAIFHGLPFATISALAVNHLFNTTQPTIAAAFGVANYITQTLLIEGIRTYADIDKPIAGVILATSCVVSQILIGTIYKINLNYQLAIALTLASFSGQLIRKCFMDENA